MQIKNLQIFSSTAAADGVWIDVSNLVNLSVYLTGIDAQTWIEVSNDPNAPINGAAIGPPSAAPVLSQFASQPGSIGNSSELPNTTFFVKTTFITKWGETTASPESSLAVTYGNYLYVAAPVPTAVTQAPYVTGYNIYVGLTSGAEVLQTTPQYQPQRLVDGVGTPGGTVSPLGPGQSTHFAISGAISIGIPGFSMVNGFQQTQWLASALTDQSGGAAVGVNITGNLPGSPASGSQVQITPSSAIGTIAMFSPSGLVFKWLRVRKTGTVALTQAFLCGQNG